MESVSLENSVRISGEVVFREIDGEAVLLDLGTSIYFGLNEVGTRIWTLLQQDGSLQRTLDALKQGYPEIPRDQLEQDLLELVSRMLEKGLLLEPSPTPA
jgi:hypothetical protein